MSTHPNIRPAPADASGEKVLFILSGAFAVVMVAIIGGVFLPVAAGVAIIFAVLFVVLGVVGRFLWQLLDG